MKEKFFVSIVLPLITNIMAIISSYILALNLDVQLMGDWAYINTIVSISFLFINVGIDYIHYQYSGKENFEELSGSYLFLKILSLFLNLTIVFFVIMILGLWTKD